jgi:hypothetical protein
LIERVVVLLLVLVAAFLVVRVVQRSRPRGAAVGPGITVVTGPNCHLCDSAVAALDAAGAPYLLATSSDIAGLTVRSLPTVLVADRFGEVLLRRSGRAAVIDMAIILSVAGVGDGVAESA